MCKCVETQNPISLLREDNKKNYGTKYSIQKSGIGRLQKGS